MGNNTSRNKASSSSEGSFIPPEIWEVIFGSVPAEALKRFKLTCRSWNALLKDKRFIYDHLEQVQEHIIRITDKVQIINPASNADHSSLPLPNEFQGSGKLSDIVHCDGLLLCIFHHPKRLAVWNPCFNRVRWVTKPRKSYAVDDFYGIGYDGVSRDNYKILRIYNKDIFEDNGFPTDKYDPPVEIYDLKSNSWKTLDSPLDWCVYSPCAGVSLKGNMYWIAGENHGPPFIQSFDFSTERFKHMSIIPFGCGAYDNVALSAFRGDKLSLLRQPIDEEHYQLGEIEVWVTNSVKDRVVSWTKLFVVWRPDLPQFNLGEDPPHSMFFIDQKNRINVTCSERLVTSGSNCICVNLYIIGKDGFKKKEMETHREEKEWTYYSGYIYLPSLVPVP
ncbi:PREDICTED: F-box/WD-40 repeat-containing protein 1-like [Camelina sativa]|uniref:F-box/WD-40 repeat-containing protein 1-like n=1 Tax=Camelina sativa TaxID=90675 RepID=A0ABM0TSM8_CAMSA|nr:PREDICTED: F-box/WD-40 repeat-containing protein 1-like [Camelina sativa]